MRGAKRSLLRTLGDAMIFVLLLAAVLLALKRGGLLEPEHGTFVAVDGDSLRKGEGEYRLHAIDAPELHQTCSTATGALYPCGREAQKTLRNLISGKELDCIVLETDRYHRLIITCKSAGRDINAEMVRLGWAIAYRQHGLDYAAAEAEAKQARRGIWQGHFDRPDQWRAEHRNNAVQGGMADDQAEPD